MAVFNLGPLTSSQGTVVRSAISGVTSSVLNNSVLGGIAGDIISNVLHIPGFNIGEVVQTSSFNKAQGAFKWVQEYLTPEMFVSADSCFIAFGNAIYSNNSFGSDFSLIGMCQDISISTGLNIYTFKELRAEKNIIVPLKSTPGSLTIRRLLTTSGTLNSLAHGSKKWAFDTQRASTKKLFGVLLAFMTPGRTQDITTLYAERCAINNMSIPINANGFLMAETMNITFDRLKDEAQVSSADIMGMGTTSSGLTASSSASSTSSSTVQTTKGLTNTIPPAGTVTKYSDGDSYVMLD